MVKRLYKNKAGNNMSAKKIETNNNLKKFQVIKENFVKSQITSFEKDKLNPRLNLIKSDKRKKGKKRNFNSYKNEENNKEIKNVEKQENDKLNPILNTSKKNHETMKKINRVRNESETQIEKNKTNQKIESKNKSSKNNENSNSKNSSKNENSNYSRIVNNSSKNNITEKEVIKSELSKDDSFDLELQIDKNMILNNKQIWAKHLEMDLSIEYDNFILLYENFKSINSLKKNNFSLLVDIVIKLTNFIKNSNECVEVYKDNIEKDYIYKKWNISLFKGYYDDVWKRKENISNYKKRYNPIIEKSIENQWNSILRFINWEKKFKYDDEYNYFWYLWFLPNKLISIWLAKLNSLTLTSNWWVKLMMEWEEYWIEILRSGGIKNWMRTFIIDDNKKEEI